MSTGVPFPKHSPSKGTIHSVYHSEGLSLTGCLVNKQGMKSCSHVREVTSRHYSSNHFHIGFQMFCILHMWITC